MTYLRRRVQLSLTHMQPELSLLLKSKPLGGGRNKFGSIIFRREGGGVKRCLRVIDFKKIIWDVPFYILRTENDPGRTGFIYLTCFVNGILCYVLATEGIDDRQCFVTTSSSNFFYLGNTLTLSQISEGTFIHSLEKRLGFGGTIARAAGTHATLLKRFPGNRVLIRLPSKEELLLIEETIATVGRVSNVDHKFVGFVSAGQMRRLGVKPVVRGVARNPIDHPHGGAGGKCQVTFWAKIAKNKNTRKKKLFTDPHIFLSRKKIKKR